MTQSIRTWLPALLLGFGIQAIAADLDGDRPFLCSLAEIYECSLDEGCIDLSTDAVNLPAIVRVDFARGELTGVLDDGATRVSKALNKQILEGKLIMQGIEQGYDDERDGSGWSLAVTQDSKEMVLTSSTDESGFIVLGSCVQE